MTRNRLAGMLLAVAVVATAAAQTDIVPIGKPAPEFPIAAKEQQQRGGNRDDIEMFNVQERLAGRLAIFYFWRTTDTYSIDLFKKFPELVKKYQPRGVAFLSISPDNADRVKELFDDGTVERFPGGSDDDPRNFYGTPYRVTQMAFGAMTHPYIVVVDPWGRIMWRGSPPDDLDGFIAGLLEETNPHGGDERWLSRKLRDAKKLLDAGELGKAYTLAKLVSRMTDESNQKHGEATGLMTQIEGKAEQWLSEAVKLEREGKREQAARIVAEISARIAETDIARKAENEIGRMRGDRRMKQAIRKALDEVQAEVELEKARLLAEDGLYDEALEAYRRIAKDFKKTEAGKLAEAERKKLLHDPAMRKKVEAARARAQARRWLDVAQRYEQLGMLDQARAYYQRIVEKHPNTPVADDARKRLAVLAKTAKIPTGPDTP